MTLFCVRDGNSANDDLIWNAPLKKVEKLHDPKPVDRYEKTPTPGVVIDRSTGKMETQIPENDGVSKPLGNPFPFIPEATEDYIQSFYAQMKSVDTRLLPDTIIITAELLQDYPTINSFIKARMNLIKHIAGIDIAKNVIPFYYSDITPNVDDSITFPELVFN